jgi:hypothetical protein
MKTDYSLWLDEYLKINPVKLEWIQLFGPKIRTLGQDVPKGNCISSSELLYGSGCVKLLPPEKWYGYPGCRASKILPGFGYYIREKYNITNKLDKIFYKSLSEYKKTINTIEHDEIFRDIRNQYNVRYRLQISFAVRNVGDLTGKREISNLLQIQNRVQRENLVSLTMRNITFENLPVDDTVHQMSETNIFVSVHGAGMTNMFFMKPGSAVIEIVPFPLCHCHNKDFFYGDGGYYHGSAIAQNIKHYTYCVTAKETMWYEKPPHVNDLDVKCSWKFLHSVKSVSLDENLFLALLRKVQRNMIADETIILMSPVIHTGPHVNG